MSVLLPLARAAHAYDRHNPEVVSQNQHDGEIKSLAFSSDGREVLSGSGDGTVKLWDVATGQVIRTFVAAGEETSSLRQRAYETFFESVTSVAFSPDGMRVLAGSNDHKIRLWEAATGRLLRTFTTKVMGQVRCVAFSPNGDRLVSGDDYSSLKLWHVESGELLRSFDRDSDRRSVVSRLWFSIKKQTYDVATCAFAPDGGHVLAGGDDKTLKLWDISTGSVVSTFSGHAAGISSVAFSSDGRRILSSSRDGTLRLWDTATGWNLRNLSEGADPIWSAALSADATRAVSGHGQGAVRLWDVTTGKVIRAFQRQSTGIISVAISPNGMTLSSASLDERTPILRTATGDVARKFGSDVNRVYAVAFSPKGTQIASGGYDKVLRLWDAASGQLVRSFSGHSWRISSVAFSPDGKRLLSGSGDKTLKLWDVASGQLLRTMEGHKDQVDSVAFSPDGTRILSSGWDRQLKLWDVATGEVVRSTSGHSFRDSAIAVSPSGLEVVSGFDESALLWDPTTGRELRTFSGHSRSTTGHTQGVTALAFSPDGRAVLSGSWDRTLKLWDVATSQPILTVQAHAGGISSVAFSSDGTRLLSASHDGTIKLWDKTSGALLRTFRGHFGAVHSATFSPNGRYIVSAGADGTIKIWDTETGTQIVSLVAGGTQDWLSITPQGFFTRSREGSELLAVVRGVEVTRIDQVHQSLFNPDLVRMALAGDPGGESREAAKLVNLDKVLDSGPAPDVAILGAASAGTSDEGLVNVEASITEKGKGIGRIEWRVNGVTAAVGTRPKGPGPDYRVLQALALDPGDNIIEVVAYNGSNLLASRPARTSIKFSGPADAVKPKLHIVTIGINAYADHGWKLAGQSQTLAFPALKLAVDDAKAFGEGMKQAGANLYEEVRLTAVLDRQASRANLDAVIDQVATAVQPRDTFILFAAAHGKSEAGRFYLIPQDYDGGPDPTALANRAIDQATLQDWLANRIKAKRVVVLLDTCESGALVGGYLRSRIDLPASEAALGRLHEAIGRPVLTAAAEGKPAFEGYKGHGIFTWAILDALRHGDRNGNGTIELSELVAHVQDVVPRISAELNGVGRAAVALSPIATSAPFAGSAQSARFGSRGEDFVLAQRLQ